MKRFLVSSVVCCVILIVATSCATQGGNGMQNNRQNATNRQATGLVLTKRENNLQTVLFLPAEVASLVGTPILETFYRYGWTQVTHADENNTTSVDVSCRLGTSGDRVIAKCSAVGRVAQVPPVSGSIGANQETIQRFGIDRVREAIVDLVALERKDLINTAVAILSQRGR